MSYNPQIRGDPGEQAFHNNINPKPYTQANFRWGPEFKFQAINLDSFEANWILELDPALDPCLHLGSSHHELSFF